MIIHFVKTEYGHELTSESKRKTWEIKVTHDITAENIENIVVDAFEASDMGNWALLDNSTPVWQDQPKDMPISQYAVEILLNGGELKFCDTEGAEDDSTWTLTIEKLLKGIQLNAENRPYDSNIEDYDGTTVDCIMQYAILGDIVFG